MGRNDKITVLVVDDYQAMRSVVIALLRKMGFREILEAEDGVLAWEVLKRNQVGLVVCDWEMPRMDGLDLLVRMRNVDEFRNTPFLMVTAEGQSHSVQNAVLAGVSDYIVKPFTPATLEEKIDKILTEQDSIVFLEGAGPVERKIHTLYEIIRKALKRRGLDIDGLNEAQLERVVDKLIEKAVGRSEHVS